MTTPIAPFTDAHRQQVPVLLTLANASRPRRPVGTRVQIITDRLGNLSEAAALIAPLGLTQPLHRSDLRELQALTKEVQAIAEAIVERRPIPQLHWLNKLSRGAYAIRVLIVAPDGTMNSTLQWQANSAVAELASRVVAELSSLDPARLRQCARKNCTLLFYDATRPGTQRWHSESPCGQRERQDRFRANRRMHSS